MTIEVKFLTALIDAAPDAGTDYGPYGGFDAILSAPTLDRDGDVFETEEWQTPLPERIPIDIDHEMSVAGTVGSAVPYFDDDGNLRVRGTFASTARAQEVRTLVQEGHITTMSVACMTDMQLKKAGSAYRELLNGAFVAIPSNRQAVVTDVKGILDVKAGARNSNADMKRIQAVHDHAAALGAACESTSDGDGAAEGANKALRSTIVVGKALTGSVEDLRARINTALSQCYAELDNGYPWLLATFLDPDGSSGTIVYELDCSDNGDVKLGREFTDDGATVTLSDEFAQVQIIQTVQQAGPLTNVDLDPDQDGDIDAEKDTVRLSLSEFHRALDQVWAMRSTTTETTIHPDGEAPDDAADAAAGSAAATKAAADQAADEAADNEVATDEDLPPALREMAMRAKARLAANQ